MVAVSVFRFSTVVCTATSDTSSAPYAEAEIAFSFCLKALSQLGLEAYLRLSRLLPFSRLMPVINAAFSLKLLHIFEAKRRLPTGHEISNNAPRTAAHRPADVALAAVPVDVLESAVALDDRQRRRRHRTLARPPLNGGA